VRAARRLAHVAALSVVACLGTGGAPARAAAPETTGVICQLGPVVEPNRPGTDEYVTQIGGGPVLLTAPDGVTPESGTLVCRVVVSADYVADHTAPGSNVAGRGTGVLTASPAVVRYTARPYDEYASLCSEFVDDSDGVTYYWNDWYGEWSTDPTVPCGPVAAPDDDAPLDPVVDSIVCPLFAMPFPPDGDVSWIWDCPPYGDADPAPDLVPDVGPLPLGCDDGIDDDADGLTDYPADPGCASPTDGDEHAFAVACDDGTDSDGDLASDYPRDPGCTSASDLSERGTNECDDGLDNDGDGSRDYVLDAGCTSPADPSESTFP
jgi:hypothetical protein